MLEDFLIVHKDVLPSYFEKVVLVRRKLEDGEYKDVSTAVKSEGISRSTYYKYKDYVLEPSELAGRRKAVISAMLSHHPGILSQMLSEISKLGASVLTIDQSLPIHGRASVTVSLDVEDLNVSMRDLLGKLSELSGVENPRILAIE